MSIKEHFIFRMKENENIDEFAIWAFGEGYENLSLSDLRRTWNDKHHLDLPIWPETSLYDWIPYMLQLWRSKKYHETYIFAYEKNSLYY